MITSNSYYDSTKTTSQVTAIKTIGKHSQVTDAQENGDSTKRHDNSVRMSGGEGIVDLGFVGGGMRDWRGSRETLLPPAADGASTADSYDAFNGRHNLR